MAFRPAVLLRRRIAQLAAAVAAVMALIGFTAAPAAAVGSVGSVSLALSSRAAGATQVTWSVHFKTTSTGALAANSGTITVAGGSGVVVSTVSCDYRITDLTSGSTASCPTLVTGTSKAQVTVPFAIGASHEVSLTMAGTKNGATASSTGTVNTSADLTAVALGNSFVAPLSVANASAARSTTAAGAKGVRWTVQFKANSPLVAGRGQIVVEGATGTVFDVAASDCAVTVQDVTTGGGASLNCDAVASTDPTGATVFVTAPTSISAQDVVVVTLGNVTNPTSGQPVNSLSTTSDTVKTSALGAASTTALPVTGVTLSPSTTAINATKTSWTVGFTTSSTGALANRFGRITITNPNGVTFDTTTQYDVADLTAGNHALTALTSVGGTSVTVPTPFDIPANHQVQVITFSTGNPKLTGPFSAVSVSTSSDTVGHPTTGAFVNPSAPTGITLATNTSAAGAQGVRWSVRLTTTATGRLTAAGEIVVAGPPGTTWPTDNCKYAVQDITAGTAAVTCEKATVTGTTVNVNVGKDMPANHALALTVLGVTNPGAAGPFSAVSVSTTSDTAVAHPASGSNFVAAAAVSAPTLATTTTAGLAEGVTWRVVFSTSAQGELLPNDGKVIVTGAGLPMTGCYSLFDLTAGTGGACVTPTLSGAAHVVAASQDFPASHRLQLTIPNVVNPPAGTQATSVSLSTTSDTVVAHPTGSAFVAANAPAGLTFTPSTTAEGATLTKWLFGFSTSSTGALVKNTGQIVISAGNANFTPSSCIQVVDRTAGLTGNCTTPTLSGHTAVLPVPFDIGAGHALSVTAVNVSNPVTADAFSSITVTTGSDIVGAHPGAGNFTPAKSVGASLSVSTRAAGASAVTWTVRFTSSSTGALVGAGAVTVFGPGSTVFPTDPCAYQLEDLTTGSIPSGQCAGAVVSGSHFTFAPGFDIPAGHEIAVTVTGVTNPGAGSASALVSTTSDTVQVPAGPVSFLTASAPTLNTFAPVNPAGGATNTHWLLRLTASTTGTLVALHGQIVVAPPSGTIFSATGCSYQVINLTTGDSSSCPAIGLIGSTVRVTVPFAVHPSDQVYVDIAVAKNPASGTLFSTVGVFTTSDTVVTHPGSGQFA